MADDLGLGKVSAELEDAGLLGTSAASMLALFVAAADRPGTLTATQNGVVWTNTVDSSSGRKVPLGIGTLNIGGGHFSCVAGFRFDDRGFSHVDLMFRFKQDDGTPSPIFLELDDSVAGLAEPKKVGSEVVGYKKDPLQPAILPLPVISAIEFSFRRGADDAFLSGLQFHDQLEGALSAATGILQLSIDDKILVLPWLFHAGIEVKDVFLDLSPERSPTFSGLFPEVYDPRWKGFGAKEINVYVPIDHKDDGEFVRAGLDGLLYGLDGRFSAKGEISYTDSKPKHLFKSIAGSVDIRNDAVVKGTFSMTLDLRSAAERTSEATGKASTPTLDSKQQALVDKTRTETESAKDEPAFDLDGQLKCQVQFFHLVRDDGRAMWGFDLSVEGIDAGEATGGLVLTGTAARTVFWLGLGGGATWLIVKGTEGDGDFVKVLGGFGLLFLLAADVGNFLGGSQLLPRIQSLAVNRLGYRWVSIPRSDDARVALHQILLDVGFVVDTSGSLVEIIEALAGRGLSTLHSLPKLFADEEDVHQIVLKGPLELELSNLPLAFEETPEGTTFVTEIDPVVSRLAGDKDLRVEAKRVPEIELKPPAGGDSQIKPLVGFEFVNKKVEEERLLGFAVKIKGLESPSLSVATPVLGIVVYILPEFKVDFETQLMVEPRFRFLVPPVLMADGLIEIDKPIPAFDGSQNRIAVDVGLFSTKLKKGATIDKDALAQLYDIKNYKYRFGGEVAWGEANVGGDPFDFLFVEVHYDGASPIVAIGPVGLYGLGGLFGRNIAPGIPGDARSALAITQWIESAGESFDDIFDNVLNWPAAPTTATWHPARHPTEDRDLYVGGLRIHAGTLDGAKTVDVEGVLMAGLAEFWLAIGALARVAPINLKNVLVVAYDGPSETFLLRAITEFKVDRKKGDIVKVKGPFEVGTGPDFCWVFLGHYENARGGPLVASLAKGLLRPQAYFVYDSSGLQDFGLPLADLERPDLSAPASGGGLAAELGPKRYGPSSLHVEIHAVAGLNVGMQDEPRLVFGQLVVMGRLQLKIFFGTFGLEVGAALRGRFTDDLIDFQGVVFVKINLPWPIPDFKRDIPLPPITLGGGDSIPRPLFRAVVSSFRRVESEAISFPAAGAALPKLPIDAVIALGLDKPMRQVLSDPASDTSLVLNEPIPPDPDALVEVVETSTTGESFRVSYSHDLTDVVVEHRPIVGGPAVRVEEMTATWEAPALYGAAAESSGQEPHHTLYLNTLLPPELGLFSERLGEFAEGTVVTGPATPCETKRLVCLIADGPPALTTDGSDRRTASTSSPLGTIRVRETTVLTDASLAFYANRKRLAWAPPAGLVLPHGTVAELPPARSLTLRLVLSTLVTRRVEALLLNLEVHVGGEPRPARIQLKVTEAQTPCLLAGGVAQMETASAGVSATAEFSCESPGVIAVTVHVKSDDARRVIERCRITGPFVLLPARPELDALQKMKGEYEKRLELRLRELCVVSASAGPDAWANAGLTSDGNGLPLVGAEAVDAFWDAQLLRPNREYTIRYAVRSAGRTVSADEDQERGFEASSDDADTGLRTVRFRTEALPSQDVKQYVGFSFPDERMQPVYASATIPLLSFKYAGLIQRIYRQHKGADVLRARVTDLSGGEIEKELTSSIVLGSGASDAFAETLLERCLPDAQGFSHVRIDFFRRELEPDTRYALTVEDVTAPTKTPPVRIAFQTSRFLDLAAHVAAVNDVLLEPAQIPVVDPATLESTLATVFDDLATDGLSGFDDVIEAIYRRILGIEEGRLSVELGGGGMLAAHIVARDDDSTLLSYGTALELDEPLLGKEGVSLVDLGSPTPLPALEGRGVQAYHSGSRQHLVVRDRSGSRVVVLHSVDASSFDPLLAPAPLRVQFDGQQALRAVIERYVGKTMTQLSELEQGALVDDTLAQVMALPSVGPHLGVSTADLLIPPAVSP